jgi:hypothetical protein
MSGIVKFDSTDIRIVFAGPLSNGTLMAYYDLGTHFVQIDFSNGGYTKIREGEVSLFIMRAVYNQYKCCRYLNTIVDNYSQYAGRT